MINVFRPVAELPAETISIESLTRDVHLKPIHSHNDYWRKRPFIDALLYGCTSIEGDIWKFPKEYSVTDTNTKSTVEFKKDEIYVGHNQVHLKPENTVENVYLRPLYQFLESANKKHSEPILDQTLKKYGVFFDSPELTLSLWFDLKTNGSDTYIALKERLKGFSEKQYLTYYNSSKNEVIEGPVAITLTGDVPWDLIEAEEKIFESRYVFLDCPLHKFKGASDAEKETYKKLCLYASASLEQLLGTEGYTLSLRRDFSEAQQEELKQVFETAHALGIKTRIWGGVDWPIYIRNMHWKSLWELGCDLINADDLPAAANLF